MSDIEQKEITASEKKKEDWMNTKWRPMVGWMYMIVCVTDFVLFPVLWSMVQAIHGGNVTSQWNPITLQGAGLFHLAMGAVLGIAAFGRTQEKMAGANNGGLTPPMPMPMTPSSVMPTPTPFSAKAPPPAPTPQL